MILLSNQDELALPTKKINIKKIQTSVKKDTSNTDTLEKDLQSRMEEIEKKEREINDKFDSTEREIARQKEEWKELRTRYIEEAQQEGYKKGFEKGGETDSIQQYRNLIDHANQIIMQAQIDADNILSQSDEKILQISMTVAEKIMNQTLTENSHSFLNIVHKVIEMVKEQPVIKVYVHDKDYSLLLDSKDELVAITNQQAELIIFTDPELQKGQVIIETPYGRIDASITTQLNEIRNRLFNVVEEISVNIQAILDEIEQIDSYKRFGKVERVVGLLIESRGPKARIGEVCYIHTDKSSEKITAEVIGFDEEKVLLMPYSAVSNISSGCLVEATKQSLSIKVGRSLIGKVIDSTGNQLDGTKLPKGLIDYPTEQAPPNPLSRPPD